MIRRVFLLTFVALAGLVPVAAGAEQQKLEILDVTSSVTYLRSAPEPGGLTTLFVRGLQGIEGTTAVTEYPAKLELSGVTVKVHGSPAPVLLVSQLDGYQQINVQVSWKANVAVKPVAEVQQGSQVAQFMDVPQVIWDVLFRGEDNYALAYKSEDWSRVTAENPIRAGEKFLLLGANLGAVTPAVADGALGPDEGLAPQLEDNPRRSDRLTIQVNAPPPNNVGSLAYAKHSCPQEACEWRLASGLLGVYITELSLEDIGSYPKGASYEIYVSRIVCNVDRPFILCKDLTGRTSSGVPIHVETSGGR